MLDLPLVVWRPGDGRIRVASESAAELAGVAVSELTGSSVFDLVEFNPHAAALSDAVRVGAVDSATQEPRPGEGGRRSRLVTRMIEIDGSREAATVLVPGAASSWPERMPMVLGYLDTDWRVTAVSAGVADIVGREPAECVGRPFAEIVPMGESPPASSAPAGDGTYMDRSVRSAEPGWVISLLVAPSADDCGSGGYTFCLVGDADGDPAEDRVAELELRLRRIGAEVRAAEVVDPTDGSFDPLSQPRFSELTRRQRQILEGLLEGKRVPRIAGDLFLSNSTVRNHLVGLFKKFGVHSQPELIELLRRPGRDARFGNPSAGSGPELRVQ